MSAPLERLDAFAAGLRRRARARRGISACALGLAGVSALALLRSVLGLVGAARPDLDPVRLAQVLAAVGACGLVAGTLVPVRRAALAREADQRLARDGALAAALEMARSPDPFCRLLARRTAESLQPASARRAIPLRPPAAVLLVPILVLLTLTVESRAVPAAPGGSAERGGLDPEVAAVSQTVQAVASELLRSGRSEGAVLERARTLLEIDEALRSGKMSLAQARTVLRAEPDASGSSRSPRDALQAARRALREQLDRVGSTGSSLGTGAGEGGAGAAAGLGAAPLRAGPRPAPEADDAAPSAQWSLPAPGVQSLDGDSSAAPARGSEESSRPREAPRGRQLSFATGRPLTDPERALVEAFDRALAPSRPKERP